MINRPPAWLSPAARPHWENVVASLGRRPDRSQRLPLGLLAELCADRAAMRDRLRADGWVVTDRQGRPRRHPLALEYARLSRAVLQLLVDLGLTPRARYRQAGTR